MNGITICKDDECLIQSDHFPIHLNLNIKTKQECSKKPTLVYDYQKADWRGLCDYLMDEDFSACFESEDVELIWAIFKLITTSAMEKFIPRVRLKNHQFPKRFDADLRHRSNCLNTLRRKCPVNKNETAKDKFMQTEKCFEEDCRMAKTAYEKRLIDKVANSGSRDLFKYIAYLKEGGVIPKTVYLNSETASNDEERASLYFNSVFTVSSYTLPLVPELPTST